MSIVKFIHKNNLLFDALFRHGNKRNLSSYGQNQDTGIDSDTGVCIGKRIPQRGIARFSEPTRRAKKLLAPRELWEKRGQHLFFIPPYSPHLNIAGILWKMLKGEMASAARRPHFGHAFLCRKQGFGGYGKRPCN